MDDAELLRRFEDLSLPPEEMTHRAHVRLAYLYLLRDPLAEAQARFRADIKAYAAARGAPTDSPTEGYNETTTMAFLQLTAAMIQAYGSEFPTATADAFCDTHPQLLTKHALRFFYSPQRKIDPRTRTEFLEPDLAPLPKVDGG